MTWKWSKSHLLNEITSINEKGKNTLNLTSTNCAIVGLRCAFVWSRIKQSRSGPHMLRFRSRREEGEENAPV